LRRESYLVIGAVVSGLLLSLAAAARSAGVFADSYEYIQSGLTLVSGQGYKSMSGDNQLWFPPFYPLLIGTTNLLLHNPILSARLVALVASVASIVLFYFVVRFLLPGAPAVTATWLYALLPLRVYVSGMAMSENVFALLVFAAVLLWLVSIRRAVLGLACGVIFGLAYLTRPEALVVLLIVAAATLVSALRQRAKEQWLRGVLLCAGFAIILFPYACYLKSISGRWQMTGKLGINLAIADASPNGIVWERLPSLSADDRTVGFARQPLALKTIAKRFARNLHSELALLPEMISPFLLVCIGLGLLALSRSPHRPQVVITCLAFAGSAFLFPFFYIEERMLVVILASLILLTAPAFDACTSSMHNVSPRLAQVLLALTALWMLAAIAERVRGGNRSSANNIAPLVSALQNRADIPGPILGNGLTLTRAVAFATGRSFLRLPWAPQVRVLHYADLHQAKLMLVTNNDHPTLAALARHPVTTDRLIPLAQVNSGSADEPIIAELYYLRTGADSRAPKAIIKRSVATTKDVAR
jgi:hypothetical protein